MINCESQNQIHLIVNGYIPLTWTTVRFNLHCFASVCAISPNDCLRVSAHCLLMMIFISFFVLHVKCIL